MTKTLSEVRDHLISERWPNKGPCLVPHKSAGTKDSWLLTCHENDFCLCNMREIWNLAIKEVLSRIGEFGEFDEKAAHAMSWVYGAEWQHEQILKKLGRG